MTGDSLALKRIDRFRREHNLVRRLLEVFGLKSQRKQLVAMQREQFGIRYLTLHAWRSFCPTFPLYMGYELLYDIGPDSSRSKLCGLASEAWHELAGVISAQEIVDGRPIGVVFPCKGVRFGMMVHNGIYRCRRYRVDQHRFESEGHTLTIEPARSVIQAIHESGWEPGSSWGSGEHAIVAAPLLRRVRSVTAKVVLRQLIDVLNRDIECEPDWLGGEYEEDNSRATVVVPGETIVRIDGRRHVLLTKQELADATGLSTDQVRTALRHLREAGLIETREHDGMYLHRVLATAD